MLIGHTISDGGGHLLAVDHAVCEILQRSERELAGVAYTVFTHPDDRLRSIDFVRSLGLFDGPVRIRKRYVRPDGSAIWAEVRASRMATADKGRLVSTIQLVDSATLACEPHGLWRSARRALATIRQRRIDLGEDLFADHAWIILLQIYLAEAEGRVIDLNGIAEGADIRVALVDRWIRALDQKCLLERSAWPDCAAQLTPTGIAKVERLLAGDAQG